MTEEETSTHGRFFMYDWSLCPHLLCPTARHSFRLPHPAISRGSPVASVPGESLQLPDCSSLASHPTLPGLLPSCYLDSGAELLNQKSWGCSFWTQHREIWKLLTFQCGNSHM